MSALAPTVAHARQQLIERAHQADDVRDLFASASRRLHRLVPFDAAVWLSTDPWTHLPTAPTRAENLRHVWGTPQACLRVWELEFLVEDINLYGDLARRETPAGGLRATTADRPARSVRYREMLRPNGIGDELRGVLCADGAPWAAVGLFRESGRTAFDDADRDLLASLSRPLAEAIREHARPVGAAADEDRVDGPGLMVFRPDGELVSANDEALAWLDELPVGAESQDGRSMRLPMVVSGTLMRAKALAEERDHRTARARVRSAATGRWLVCHASCLRDADGRLGDIALVIEPATGSEIAPIIVQAYDLTPREQQITQLIARGHDTAQIARGLCLSGHTVRDHVKAIFEKVGVRSRGELVATLFAEHYAPLHHDPAGVDQV